jgi:peptidoglycan/LPS O-acetylase OafA/YrhL
VAALMVALSHSLLAIQVDGIAHIWSTPLAEVAGLQSAITRALLIPFNGGAAVTVFFVLSGFVLGLSLDRNRQTLGNTAGFYLKRLFRLYPAHIVVLLAIVASLLAFHRFEAFEAASGWYLEWYRVPPDFGMVLDNLALISVYLNHIAWSLQVELAGSLFLPFAYFVCRRSGLWLNALVLALLVVLAWQVTHLLLLFLYCFYAGLMLPQLVERLSRSLGGASGQTLLFLGIVLLCGGYTFAGPQSLQGRILLETLGSVLIIAHLVHEENRASWVSRFLSRPLIRQLGRYSYSFYLLHYILLYWLAYVVFENVSAEMLLAMPLFFGFIFMLITVPLTYYLAGVVYRNVEVPMINLGKKLVGDPARRQKRGEQTLENSP